MVKSLEPIELTKEWTETIRNAAPDGPVVSPRKKRKALMFSVSTGFYHWVIPHTAAMLKVLGEKTGAFEIVETDDPKAFVPENLDGFDSIFFNNNCPEEPRQDTFFDLLHDEKKASDLKDNIIDYVARGGGFVSIHGGLIAFNNCPHWDEMQGGSFDYHPAQQHLALTAVNSNHPLTAPLGTEPFVHVDEPYLFRGSYAKTSFRPLLQFDGGELAMPEGKPALSGVCYAAWIKKHGKGRFFYCAPSHNAQSFADSRLLQFILNGVQYAFGDLECDDTPLSG